MKPGVPPDLQDGLTAEDLQEPLSADRLHYLDQKLPQPKVKPPLLSRKRTKDILHFIGMILCGAIVSFIDVLSARYSLGATFNLWWMELMIVPVACLLITASYFLQGLITTYIKEGKTEGDENFKLKGWSLVTFWITTGIQTLVYAYGIFAGIYLFEHNVHNFFPIQVLLITGLVNAVLAFCVDISLKYGFLKKSRATNNYYKGIGMAGKVLSETGRGFFTVLGAIGVFGFSTGLIWGVVLASAVFSFEIFQHWQNIFGIAKDLPDSKLKLISNEFDKSEYAQYFKLLSKLKELHKEKALLLNKLKKGQVLTPEENSKLTYLKTLRALTGDEEDRLKRLILLREQWAEQVFKTLPPNSTFRSILLGSAACVLISLVGFGLGKETQISALSKGLHFTHGVMWILFAAFLVGYIVSRVVPKFSGIGGYADAKKCEAALNRRKAEVSPANMAVALPAARGSVPRQGIEEGRRPSVEPPPDGLPSFPSAFSGAPTSASASASVPS